MHSVLKNRKTVSVNTSLLFDSDGISNLHFDQMFGSCAVVSSGGAILEKIVEPRLARANKWWSWNDPLLEGPLSLFLFKDKKSVRECREINTDWFFFAFKFFDFYFKLLLNDQHSSTLRIKRELNLKFKIKNRTNTQWNEHRGCVCVLWKLAGWCEGCTWKATAMSQQPVKEEQDRRVTHGDPAWRTDGKKERG